MKYSLLLAVLLSTSTLFGIEIVQDLQLNEPITMDGFTETALIEDEMTMQSSIGSVNNGEPILEQNKTISISVIGQGVAPANTLSPAQAYALARRAAVADAYRMIAEKVKGVRIDGQDLIKNMMVKRSIVRTSVQAMVKNANVVETTFKEGLCEVEMEITLSHSDF